MTDHRKIMRQCGPFARVVDQRRIDRDGAIHLEHLYRGLWGSAWVYVRTVGVSAGRGGGYGPFAGVVEPVTFRGGVTGGGVSVGGQPGGACTSFVPGASGWGMSGGLPGDRVGGGFGGGQHLLVFAGYSGRRVHVYFDEDRDLDAAIAGLKRWRMLR